MSTPSRFDDEARGVCKMRHFGVETAATEHPEGKRLGKNAPQFDARAALARWAGVDLTRINGLSVTTVMTILSEIGPDLSRFASIKHFCSWLGRCPGTKISGGKVLSARTRLAERRVRALSTLPQ